MNKVSVETICNYKGMLMVMILALSVDLSYLIYFEESNIYFQLVLYSIAFSKLQNMKIISTKTVYNKNNTGLIITDPGEDIDDEVALYHLIKQTKDGIMKFSKIFIVFANGEANSKMSSNDRLIHFKKMFPEFDSNETKISNTEFILLTTDCLKYINGYHFDVFLQIAPLCGINPQFFEQNSINQRIIMGDYNDPDNSLNLKKSWKNNIDLDNEFDRQEKAMRHCQVKYITTSLARSVPLTYNNIYNLPTSMYETLIDKAFRMFVGRVPYSSPHCANVTINSNVQTAKNYLGKNSNKIIDDYIKNMSQSEKDIIEHKCNEFINKMVSCDDKNKMLESLIIINSCVELVTKCKYKDSNFTCESLDNVNDAKSNFIEHITSNKSDLTPAYDMTAMILFMRPDINGKRFDVSSSCFFKYRLKDY